MTVNSKNSTDYLDRYEMAKLFEHDIDEIWYNYEAGGYEGSGQMIARKGDLYTHHDLSHCSCYGPLENFELENMEWDALVARLQANPEYYNKEIKPFLKSYYLV